MAAHHVQLKTKKIELDPYKNPFLTDPIPENAVLNRTFYDVIRLKDQKFCFEPYRIAQKYGYRWENRVLIRTDNKTGAKSTVKNHKNLFLTVTSDFLYGYTM